VQILRHHGEDVRDEEEEEASWMTWEERTHDGAQTGMEQEEEEVAVEEAFASPMEAQAAFGSGETSPGLAYAKAGYRMVEGEGEVEGEDLDEIADAHQLNGPREGAPKQMV
jgi:hypothetical protein